VPVLRYVEKTWFEHVQKRVTTGTGIALDLITFVFESISWLGGCECESTYETPYCQSTVTIMVRYCNAKR